MTPVLLTAALLVPVGPGAAVPLPGTENGAHARAAAVVAPATVAVTVNWHAWVRDKRTGEVFGGPTGFQLTMRCTGFVVHASGPVVTASGCVDPGGDGTAPMFRRMAAEELARVGRTPEARRAAVVLAEHAVVEGLGDGMPPNRAISVHWGRPADAVPAEAVAVGPRSEGGVALLRVAVPRRLPAAELAPRSAIRNGTAFQLIAPHKTVTGQVTRATEPLHEVSTFDSTLRGAPAVDASGRVIGMAAPKGMVTDVTAIVAALRGTGSPHGLGALDRNWRTGLDLYYAGRYSSAMAHFDAVLAATGEHAQATEFRRLATERRVTAGDRPHAAATWALVAGAIGLLAGVAALILGLVRPRPRVRA